MNAADAGKALIALGLVAIVLGALLVLLGKVPLLGRLPGDVVISRPSFTVYAPLATCLLLSVAGSLLLWLWRRF